MFCKSLCKIMLLATGIALISACDSNSSTNTVSSSSGTGGSDFSLQFSAQVDGMELNCTEQYNNLGPEGSYSIGVGDLRFYVSNLKFYDNSDVEIAVTLDSNDFQLNHDNGSVSLIDLSPAGTSDDYCGIQSGTPRVNGIITGQVADDAIASVSFDVGVPQATMKAVIAAAASTNDAPSPLAELDWSWASGYKHFSLNFTTMDATHTELTANSGVHFGSRDCGAGETNKALSERDQCGLLNTPKVRLSDFDPSVNRVVVDIAQILANLNDGDFNVGGSFGLQCHSGQAQASCDKLFNNFGVNLATGLADATDNSVFVKQ